MISPQEFDALVATYEKHGWLLRRIILVEANKRFDGHYPGVAVKQGAVDAAWFSRPPKAGAKAWEIRHLGATQYALIEHLDENSSDFEQKLHQTEQRMADALRAK